MTTKKRKIVANFLKVKENFEFLGTEFISLNEKPSVKTTSKKYINDSSATQRITGYE
ncbi:hypothetical protein [Clostridium sp. M14]|uniref:hypothetical protein n=1 Tax=Clostridium sp. M14 TaxID=2716311 RepID=UPI0029624153|nr:hypothetical protein [Clostridium sp. M14]